MLGENQYYKYHSGGYFPFCVLFVCFFLFEQRNTSIKNIIKKWKENFALIVLQKKNIENFHKKYTECKNCNCRRSLKCYYENKDKISNQKKLYYEKIRENFLQKQNKG